MKSQVELLMEIMDEHNLTPNELHQCMHRDIHPNEFKQEKFEMLKPKIVEEIEQLVASGKDLSEAAEIVGDKYMLDPKYIRGEFDESYRLSVFHD